MSLHTRETRTLSALSRQLDAQVSLLGASLIAATMSACVRTRAETPAVQATYGGTGRQALAAGRRALTATDRSTVQRNSKREHRDVKLPSGVLPPIKDNDSEQSAEIEGREAKKQQFAFTLSQEAQFAMVHGYKDKIMDMMTTETPSGDAANENDEANSSSVKGRNDILRTESSGKKGRLTMNFSTRPPSPVALTLSKDAKSVQSAERRRSCSSIQPFRFKSSTLSKDAINQLSVGRRSSYSSIPSHRPKSCWNSEATRPGVVPSAPPPKSGSMYRKLQNLRERALSTNHNSQNGASNAGTSSRLTRRRQSLPAKLTPKSQVVTQLLQTEITLMDALKLDKTISAPTTTTRRHSSETFADLISSLNKGMKLLDE